MPSRDRASCAALVLALAVAGALGGSAARADDLDDAAPLQRALDASRQVLLLVPQAVRQDCVDALRELSSTKDSVEFNTRARGVHNLGVARDVLAADYDGAARSCGADAARACASPAGTGRTPALARACAQMQPLPPP